MFYYLIYVSDASCEHDQDAINAIFQEAVAKNEKNNISGFLTFKKGNFLQLLEGDKQDVKSLYSKIQQDSRHKNITLIAENQIVERAFNDYASGFLTPLNGRIYKKFSEYLNFLKLLENQKINKTVSALEVILSKM